MDKGMARKCPGSRPSCSQQTGPGEHLARHPVGAAAAEGARSTLPELPCSGEREAMQRGRQGPRMQGDKAREGDWVLAGGSKSKGPGCGQDTGCGRKVGGVAGAT